MYDSIPDTILAPISVHRYLSFMQIIYVYIYMYMYMYTANHMCIYIYILTAIISHPVQRSNTAFNIDFLVNINIA